MPLILGIESSCDETSAAIMRNGKVLANVISSQLQHGDYGGVVPELASRLHQQQIVRVVRQAIKQAGIRQADLDAVAFTRGPGLLGSLLVGACFAKAFALGLGIPILDVNHLQAHVFSNFLSDDPPEFPFLCLTVSGGHTQLVLVKDHQQTEILGQSIDDAAGEAFDKAAKLMDLPYPGGPEIDKWASKGKPGRFEFPTPEIDRFSFSFSGIKTSMLYLLRNGLAEDPEFIEKNKADICAAYQDRIVRILLDKLTDAVEETGVRHVAIAGGVSANSELRSRFKKLCVDKGWKAHIPAFEYCTDNAAMIAMAGHFKYLANDFADLSVAPFAREHKG
jgi:N6-L-threonylcarbamoyladenine synthase